MTKPKEQPDNKIKVREPQKKTQGGIFDRMRALPHPVEELLGLPLPEDRLGDTLPESETVVQSKTASLSETPSLNKTVSYSKTVPENTPARIPRPSRGKAVSPSETALQSTTVSESERVVLPDNGWLQVSHYVSDVLAPSLKPAQWAVWFQLFRLAHGWGRDWCLIGTTGLEKRTNLKATAIKEAIRELETLGLVEIIEVVNTKEIKGTRYRVHTRLPSDTVSDSEMVSGSATVPQSNPMKHDDDHDLSKKDHHHSAPARDATMTAIVGSYESLTGREWSQSDEKAYRKVEHLGADRLRELMQTIHARAEQPIGSFSYFAVGIQKELSPAGQQSLAALRKKYEKFAAELAANSIGRNDYYPSERIADLKAKCLREGVTWNDDLANEALGL